MNLPHYYLADQPPEADLTPTLVREACLALKRNRSRHLADISTDRLIDVLSEVAARWRHPDDPYRHLALDLGPGKTRFSRETLALGLDAFFASVTPASLEALLAQDLGQLARLDQFASTEPEKSGMRAALATGPELLVHIAAGNLPCPALAHMVLGLLVRSAQFVKCATGASLIPRLFAHSIHAVDSHLGACLELAEWPGERREDLLTALEAEADALTATGSDETLAAIQSRLELQTTPIKFLGYGSRTSFGYLAAESLTRFNLPALATACARDVAMWDQQGCLSPHVFYVEEGGAADTVQFAEALAAALDQSESVQPRGEISIEEAALIRSRRDIHQMRAAHSDETRVWSSEDATVWTVVFEADPLFQLSPLNRFVYVKPVPDLTGALRAADRVRHQISTVGLAAPRSRATDLARQLARWGVTRVCPLGRMQHPPLAWRHDGRPALESLVRWTDWEQETT